MARPSTEPTRYNPPRSYDILDLYLNDPAVNWGPGFDVGQLKGLRLLRMLRLLKLIRMVRITSFLARWENQLSVSYAVIAITKFFFIVILCAHWLGNATPRQHEIYHYRAAPRTTYYQYYHGAHHPTARRHPTSPSRKRPTASLTYHHHHHPLPACVWSMVGKDSSLADTGTDEVGSWIDEITFGNGKRLSVADSPSEVYVLVSETGREGTRVAGGTRM